VEVVCLYSENNKDLTKVLRVLNVKPIVTYMTIDKLPGVPETDSLVKQYARQNCSKDMIYPDGLEVMFPDLL